MQSNIKGGNKLQVLAEMVSESHDKWQHVELQKLRDFIKENLSKEHLIAIQFYDLDYQVRNYGFYEWYLKGYSIDLPDLITYCQNIGTEACMIVGEILENISKIISSYTTHSKEVIQLLENNGFRDDAKILHEVLRKKFLDSLDQYFHDYKDVNFTLIQDVERYLKRMSKETKCQKKVEFSS